LTHPHTPLAPLPTSVTPHAGARLDALDGFRAFAVAWVVAFHYFFFWTPTHGGGVALLPDAPISSAVTAAPFGYLGVSFFFVISGFVILMTLEKTQNLAEFAVRRCARLWPPLLLCGSITFFTVNAIGPDILKANGIEYAISMLIVPPQYLNYIIDGVSLSWLDGAYWSLWAEVRFYAIFGVAYFVFGRRYLVVWLAFEALTAALSIGFFVTGAPAFDLAGGLLISDYTPLFTLGVCLARIHSGAATRLDAYAIVFAIAHQLFLILKTVGVDSPATIVGVIAAHIAFGLLFAALLRKEEWLSVFAWRPFARIGAASYLIYLLHQSFGLTLILALTEHAHVPALIATLSVAAAIFAGSLFLHDAYERPAQKLVLKFGLGPRSPTPAPAPAPAAHDEAPTLSAT